MFQKITLIGVGLLGGSLGLAIQQRRLATTVHGYVRRAASIQECEKLGVVNQATDDLLAAVKEADLIILCTPLALMQDLTRQMLPALKPGAIVTDVGSVKASVVSALETLLQNAGIQFIGSHPMAGGEKMGASAARADLFNNAVCVVTPTSRSQPAVTEAVEQFWRALGSRVLRLSPEIHDQLVSRSSHLPHVIAAELASYVLNPAHPKEQGTLCATGFRDTTRIASGSPEMWRDIALANRENLSAMLGSFISGLEQFRQQLASGDAKAVYEFFEKAKQQRDGWQRENYSNSTK